MFKAFLFYGMFGVGLAGRAVAAYAAALPAASTEIEAAG
jgi:hypothetical protein